MRKIFLLSFLITLTSCADRTLTKVEEVKEKAAPTTPVVPQPEPAVEAPKPKPKLIAGKYVVKSTQRGKMSWYSVKTNGGTVTASGKKFSNSGATAAHRTLRFGTKVRVTNLSNGRSEIVTITDRGPFIKGRIIDVSIGTAGKSKLNFVNAGVVSCKVEVLGTP
ncbi:MAG: septal ring lytic transglycosylase RlpA family protein [Roseibacillus sp.]